MRRAKKELGYSLTWYVNAQAYYPAQPSSPMMASTRLSKQILSPETVDSPAQVQVQADARN